MGEPWFVLFRDGPPADWARAADVLDRASPTLTRGDATKACRFGHGLVFQPLPATEARAAADALERSGLACLAFPAAQLVQPPRAFTLLNAQFREDGLDVPVDSTGALQLLPWPSLRVLHRVQVRPVAIPLSLLSETEYQTPEGDTVRLPDPLPGLEPDAKEPETWLELYGLTPLLRLRIRAHAFNYGCLGPRRAASSSLNFALLLQEFLRFTPHAAHVGFSSTAATAHPAGHRRLAIAEKELDRLVTALLTREALVGLPRGDP
jgi:hypothetical protein